MKMNNINKIVAGLFLMVTVSSCVKDDNSPGYEYMPDMYRSPAIEAYVDYGEVRHWRPTDSLKNRLTALQPPAGTIPFTGENANELTLPYKRLPSKAMVESHGVITTNFSETDYDESVADLSPIAYDLANAEKGKVLYERFCDHCHGEKGAGDGQVAIASDGLISPPANAFEKPEGQMFYSITYGKGVMGAHASQLNKKDRWEVIQYLKVLNNDGEFPAEVLESEVSDTLDVVSNEQ
jgi:mono/diheme cytochrome c family protein